MSAFVPQGKPDALNCRWCKIPKLLHRGSLMCRVCDGPAHLVRPVSQRG